MAYLQRRVAVPAGLTGLEGRASIGDLSREVLRAMPGAGFFLLDTDLRITFAEGAALRLAGHEPSRIEGQAVLEVLPPHIAHTLGPLYARALGGETVSTDISTETNGTTHWVQAAPVRDANGAITGVTVISLDVTEHRRSTEDVARSEERHRSMFEALEEGILLVDGKGEILSCNPSAERIVGLRSDQVVGRYATREAQEVTVLTEDGEECPPELFPASIALQTGEAQLGTILGVRREDGEVRWVSANAVPLPDDGQGARVVASFLDITDSRLATEQLRRREEAVTRTMHDAPIGIAVVSIDGRYQSVNPAMCRMMGRTAEEMLELTFQQVTHPERAEADAEAMQRLLDGEIDNVQAAKRYLRPDGSTVSALVSVTLLRDSDGTPTQFVTQAVDMSDRLHAEEELRRRVEQQSAVARLGQHALEGVESTRLLDEAAEAIADTLDVDLVGVLELCDEGRGIRLAAGHGFPGGMVRGPSSPMTDMHRAGLEQLRNGPLAFDDFESAHGPNDLLHRFGVKSSMSVLIGERAQPFGALGVYNRSPRHFNDLDASFVQSVANVLWNAIARRESEQVIRHQALHDPLTGLPNRALFLDRLTQALARARRHHTRLAVMLLDLDQFKLVNDSLGHHAGDELLRAVTPRLAEALRAEDTVARLGGDEFVVLCEDIDDERELSLLATRISDALGRPFVLDGSEHFIRASVGAVIADATATPDGLVRDADAAMYRAKERGRGRFELFDETMRSRAVVRLQTEADLRRALDRHELELFYQPYHTLSDDHTLVGMEALVRWNHPERGMLLPGDFIPIAEDSGLIVEVGEYVLREACLQLASWRSQLEDPGVLGVSVNVSARQLMQPGLVEVVRSALVNSGLDREPQLVGLEITESVLVDSGEAPEIMLAQLKALGVNLVLDDFGTGYSSLSHLKRFPFDVMKIDRAFIDGLGKNDGEDDAIVTATMGMGSAMRLDVVAEGVETPEQIERLRALGCEVAQGYHFSEPLPADRMGALVVRELGPRVAVRAAGI